MIERAARMITYDSGPARFNYRIAGVAIDRGRVLVQRAESDDFWCLPGGRAELLEPATATLVREMREELGVEVGVGRLVWVLENFFPYAGRDWHELAFYFLMSFPHDPVLYAHQGPFEGREGDLRLIFSWQPLDRLDDIVLLPSFLRQGLRALPPCTTHIVHRDREEESRVG
jgi:8-oxo-dGTP pyrophosphatase MutT (NUDIX family)